MLSYLTGFAARTGAESGFDNAFQAVTTASHQHMQATLILFVALFVIVFGVIVAGGLVILRANKIAEEAKKLAEDIQDGTADVASATLAEPVKDPETSASNELTDPILVAGSLPATGAVAVVSTAQTVGSSIMLMDEPEAAEDLALPVEADVSFDELGPYTWPENGMFTQPCLQGLEMSNAELDAAIAQMQDEEQERNQSFIEEQLRLAQEEAAMA